eukprot:910232_1
MFCLVFLTELLCQCIDQEKYHIRTVSYMSQHLYLHTQKIKDNTMIRIQRADHMTKQWLQPLSSFKNAYVIAEQCLFNEFMPYKGNLFNNPSPSELEYCKTQLGDQYQKWKTLNNGKSIPMRIVAVHAFWSELFFLNLKKAEFRKQNFKAIQNIDIENVPDSSIDYTPSAYAQFVQNYRVGVVDDKKRKIDKRKAQDRYASIKKTKTDFEKRTLSKNAHKGPFDISRKLRNVWDADQVIKECVEWLLLKSNDQKNKNIQIKEFNQAITTYIRSVLRRFSKRFHKIKTNVQYILLQNAIDIILTRPELLSTLGE